MITVLSLSPAIDKIYLVENFEAGKHFRTGNIIKSAGGKGINVARVLSILGEEVTTLGFKAGISGDWLESKLIELNITAKFISVPGESRTNSNIIDKVRGTETELLEVGPNIFENSKSDFLKLFEDSLGSSKIIVCSGGLPEGLAADFYRVLIDKAGQLGIKTILDSSNETLAEGIKSKPYIVKPNLRELSNYTGRVLKDTNEIIDACRKIIQDGVDIVVTSLGSEGAILVSNEEILLGKIPTVEVINTIGSGDSVVAGLAFGYSHGYSVKEMFRLGIACGIANTQFAQIGIVSKELVQKYLKDIEIKIVDE